MPATYSGAGWGQSAHSERIHSPVACGRPTRVLVVDDDRTLQHMLSDYLAQYNMRAVSASQAADVSRQFASGEPTIVLLERQLGRYDGLDLLREIRSRSDVPIIMTGHRHDEIDWVVGLELGADDYVTKPFGLRELLARIRAVIRRREVGLVTAQREAEQGRCRFGGWELDRRLRRLKDPNGNEVPLTKGEYALLLAFVNAPLRPLSREQLLQATRIHEDVFDRSIDVQILRLRRKLKEDPHAPRLIRTERGVGYVFTIPVEPPPFGVARHLLGNNRTTCSEVTAVIVAGIDAQGPHVAARGNR